MRCACRSESQSLQDGLAGNRTGQSGSTGLSYHHVSGVIWKDNLRRRWRLGLPGSPRLHYPCSGW